MAEYEVDTNGNSVEKSTALADAINKDGQVSLDAKVNAGTNDPTMVATESGPKPVIRDEVDGSENDGKTPADSGRKNDVSFINNDGYEEEEQVDGKDAVESEDGHSLEMPEGEDISDMEIAYTSRGETKKTRLGDAISLIQKGEETDALWSQNAELKRELQELQAQTTKTQQGTPQTQATDNHTDLSSLIGEDPDEPLTATKMLKILEVKEKAAEKKLAQQQAQAQLDSQDVEDLKIIESAAKELGTPPPTKEHLVRLCEKHKTNSLQTAFFAENWEKRGAVSKQNGRSELKKQIKAGRVFRTVSGQGNSRVTAKSDPKGLAGVICDFMDGKGDSGGGYDADVRKAFQKAGK